MFKRGFLQVLLAGCGLWAAQACAETEGPSVAIDTIRQRWPWNNKVDISYRVDKGGEDRAKTFRKIVFTGTVGGKEIVIDGATIGAPAWDGKHTVTWTAPEGLKATTVALKAALYEADVPSGDDYMIVDLETGAITYEGLYASQDASNARYNTAPYKETKMVLRKIPKGVAYTTGDDEIFASDPNSGLFSLSRTWTPSHDFYVAVFECTITQWKTIMGADYDGSVFAWVNDHSGDIGAHRAAHRVSWNMLRGKGTLPITPLLPDASGTVLQRLNARTVAASGIQGFDLPTDAMFEIACRAGRTSRFFWGDDVMQYATYVACKESVKAWCLEGKSDRPRAVGSYKPNDWGLYDMSGNMWEWCLDDVSLKNLAEAADLFVPAYVAGTGNRRLRGGGPYSNDILASNKRQFYCAFRNTVAADNKTDPRGFRVAWIRK